jgi:uncharacterized membrane protein YkoI
MKMRNVSWLILGAGLFIGCASEKTEKPEGDPKLSKAQAQKIALTQAPNGTVKEGELEKEKGRLIWSFDISSSDSKDITEVQVDAKTGQIVAVEKETPKQEAKEK